MVTVSEKTAGYDTLGVKVSDDATTYKEDGSYDDSYTAANTVFSRSFFADSSIHTVLFALCSCVCFHSIFPSVSFLHKQGNTLMHQNQGHTQHLTPYNS